MLHLAVDAHGMPVSIIVTKGTTADCTQACALIEGLKAEHLLADRGYDSNSIINQAESQGMNVVIPPKKNRRVQRSYDEGLYRIRHLVKNAFLHIKRWRGLATRYARSVDLFVAAIQIRCLMLWARII